MAKEDKTIKSIVKQVEKRMKKMANNLLYAGEVQYLCQIGKYKNLAKNGNLVMVRKGAVHFVKDPKGDYVKINGKFKHILSVGNLPDGPFYMKSRDVNVVYLYFGDRWVKVD